MAQCPGIQFTYVSTPKNRKALMLSRIRFKVDQYMPRRPGMAVRTCFWVLAIAQAHQSERTTARPFMSVASFSQPSLANCNALSVTRKSPTQPLRYPSLLGLNRRRPSFILIPFSGGSVPNRANHYGPYCLRPK